MLYSEVDIPDKLMAVGSTLSPKDPCAGVVSANSEETVGRQERTNTHGITMTSPPSMIQVLYRDSYDDFMQWKYPVVPESHCWNAQQNVYIGCQQGQLLLVDFETGIVSMIANPVQLVTTVSVSYMRQLIVKAFVILAIFTSE